jgi:hypothetical protein
MKKLFTFILIFCSSIVLGDIRQEILLNGTWQGVRVQGNSQLPKEGWQETVVPGKMDSTGTGQPTYFWIKRQIEIPKEWAGKRIFVKFGGAGYDAHAYIDENLIGQTLDGWTPFEFEITSFVEAGSSYSLQLRCQDRTALYPADFVFEPNQFENVLQGKILAPLGGHKTFFGTTDDIWLISRPEIFIDDFTIITSTRKNQIRIKGTISETNENDLWVEGKVIDNNETALEILEKAVDANGWKISADFPNAKYWSPENPHLYKLNLTLHKGKNGPIVDSVVQRFGFKEFWIEGPDFYLNGIKRHLLASSTWPVARQLQSYDEVRKALELIKAGNNNAFRFHTAPWPKRWIDTADEVGIMIVDEAAVYTDLFGMYAYNDQRFWDNYRTHLREFVKRDKNNASLIMWSIENEILFMGMDRYCPDLPKKLGDMGRYVKQIDPYHPITFEADVDPNGATDVIGLHYPHELPTFADWPNTADWLNQRTQTEAGGGMLGEARRNFYWDRKKPLYIGEYLWVPQQDYSAGTIFFGDDAYRDKLAYQHKAKLQAWIDQTIAYRRMGVSGLCPWSCFEHGVRVDERDIDLYEAEKYFYRPVAAFLRNKDERFFAGDVVERTFDLFNDSAADCNLILKWQIKDFNQNGEEKITLKPGEYKPVTIKMIAPDINSKTEFYLQSNLLAESNTVNTKYSVEKRQGIKLPAGANVFLYDPCETFVKNVPSVQRISSFNNLQSEDILIIAEQMEFADGKQANAVDFNTTGFLDFIKKGGKAVILEQNSLDRFGFNLKLEPKASTMTFALNKNHPILKGLQENDLKFWRGDNYVTNFEISRPASGGAKAIVVSGGNQGLEHCAILEQPFGKGNVLFLQVLTTAKFNSEPASRKILQNSIDYLAAKNSKENKTLVLSEDEKFTDAIARIGVSYGIAQDINESILKNTEILVLQGNNKKIIDSKEIISAYLNSGKTVYWHCPDTNVFKQMKDVFKADNFEIMNCRGPVAINLRENNLLNGISREDLMFIKNVNGWHREISIDPAVIDRALMPIRSADDTQGLILASGMKYKGNTVVLDNNEIIFNSKGTALGEINVEQAGLYDLTLLAKAKAEREIYPMVLIKVKEEVIAQISLTSEDFKEYRFIANLPAGKSKLEITYLNGDDWNGQRTLMLHGLGVGSMVKNSGSIELLTLPAALANIKVGDGRLIVDCVRWENDANNVKGMRYASALFANIGTSFETNKK